MFRRVARWLRGDAEAAAGLPAVPSVPARDWLAEGNADLAAGRLEQALECYRRATAANAADPLAWLNHGFAALETGHLEVARDSFGRCLALAGPQDRFLHEVHFLDGRALAAQGDLGAAEQAWRAGLALAPGFLEARTALGEALLGQGRAAEALAVVESAPPSALQPELAVLRARALDELGRSEEALGLLDAVLAQYPAHGSALDGRGIVLLHLERLPEAKAALEQAVAAGGPHPDRLLNLSAACQKLGLLQEAEQHADRALGLQPAHAQARWNRAVIRLQQGRFAEGWSDFEARWDAQQVPAWMRRAGPAPEWRGENLGGRGILLNCEQGLGDSIQFLRYVPLLAGQAARVCLRLPPALVDLARGSGLEATVLAMEEPLPQVDFQCPLLSLPRLLGTTEASIPAAVPYLRADPGRRAAWERQLAPLAGGRLRVGLVWSGNPAHANDSNRSIPLELLRQQLAGADAFFVGLQPEVRASDRQAQVAWAELLPAGTQLTDFGATAALIETLDLVVCVDTSVAHLAGALARPVWILLPWLPDWRWMLEREESPWYPSARLFRQTHPRDWSGPLRRVRDELAVEAARRNG